METWACSACGGDNPAGMRFCGHCGAPAPAASEPAEAPTDALAGAATTTADVADALKSFVAGPVAEKLVEAGGWIPEERRLITALFADVSGFTALAERLDPEELQEVIDPVVGALSSIVGRYGGYVEKFAGDALLALFGAPVSHEDDAERALLVALEMHRELERIVEQVPREVELSLHVGVNSGHGIARILGSEARMDYAVLGDSVILAQRLESAAPSGETYVSESTTNLTRGRFEFEPVGELSLKGKREPVPAWRLVRERRAPRASTSRRLIGRRSDLQAATAALAGGVVSVIGEPGVGKSRLTEEVRSVAEARGMRWLHTRCLSYGAAVAYWPYVELLRTNDGDGTDNPFFARLLGIGGAEQQFEPEAFRRGLHLAFAGWLRDFASQRPTVLAIEDVHWFDPSSLALTAELVPVTREVPLTLYVVARPEATEMLSDLGDQTTIALERLDVDATAELIEALLGDAPPDRLVQFVAARTAGNPFFVEETVRSLDESNALERVEGRWQLRPGWDARHLPQTVEEVLSARIDLLPRPTSALLQTASVIGRRIALPLLRRVHEEKDIDESLDDLIRRGFLDAGVDRVTFHHALVQDAAYSRLLRRQRRELHRRVAETAEEMYGSGDDIVDLLARHLYLADAGEKAVAYLVRAGERAKRLFANEEATLHLTRASELAPDDDAIALQLADVHELVGRYGESLSLYIRVRDRSNDVRAWRGIAATLRKRGEFEAALATVDTAFGTDALRGADLAPLWLEQGWTLSSLGRYKEAVDVLQAGLEAVGERRDAPVADILLRLARAESVEGAFEAAVRHALEAQAIFERAEDVRGVAAAMRVVGDAYRYLGRLDAAADALRRGLELAERVGSVEEIGGCLINLGIVEAERGALAEAIACDRRAIEEFDRVGHASGRVIGHMNLADKLARAGEYADAELHCARAIEFARSIGHAAGIAAVTDTLAMIELGRGRADDAAARAEEAAALFLEQGVAPNAADSLELAGEAWEQAGNVERARESRARARSLRAKLG